MPVDIHTAAGVSNESAENCLAVAENSAVAFDETEVESALEAGTHDSVVMVDVAVVVVAAAAGVVTVPTAVAAAKMTGEAHLLIQRYASGSAVG